VLGKTGQQIKIVEAMAHGLPVVVTRAAAESAPLQHGQTGLVANDAAEFAAYVIQLWRDRELCQAMGRQARAVIVNDYSLPQLVRWLEPIFGNSRLDTPADRTIGVQPHML
jgi:glycosyltransferase involved in cell wall biosynthesis